MKISKPEVSNKKSFYLQTSNHHNKKGDYKNLSDQDLWNCFVSGDEGAFVLIYQNYVDTLFNYGLQYTQDENLLKDTLQDFFIYLREKSSRLSPTNSIKFYLLKSFKRRLLQNLNSLKKKNKMEEVFMNEELFKFELSYETKLIDRQFTNQQLDALNAAIKKLSAKEKEVIYLFFFENLTYREISEIQGYLHISSARRLVYKALDQLRLNLKMMLFLLFVFHEFNRLFKN